MNRTTIAYTIILVVAIYLTWISVAWAEDLTIDYVSITESEWNNGIKYISSGSAPIYTCLDITVIKPNGSEADITYDVACTNTEPQYQFEGYIINPFNADDWTMQICNPTNSTNICVDRDFNISFLSLTNSTSTIPVEEYVEVSATDGIEYDVNTGEPLVETETTPVIEIESADNETLNLRLEILKVLESILAILFSK